MGDYLRLLTVNDRDIPLASLQRAVPNVAIWSVDHPGTLGNYLAIGPELNALERRLGDDRAQSGRTQHLGRRGSRRVHRQPRIGRAAVGRPLAERLPGDDPRHLRDPDLPRGDLDHPEAEDAVFAVRSALRDAVGGIGQWDGQGFTNEDDRLIWCDPKMTLKGRKEAALLDESTGEWIPLELNLEDPEELAQFLRGELPKKLPRAR